MRAAGGWEVTCTCKLRRGMIVVVACCTCAPEGRPRRKVVALSKDGRSVRLDRGVVLLVCDRAHDDTRRPRPVVWQPRDYVHRPTCPEVTP